MSSFFQRGGVWVLAQSVLLAAVILLAVFFRGGGFQPVAAIAGVALLIIGTGGALAGALALGRNLTPFPKPGAQAQLVRHGVYAAIRHCFSWRSRWMEHSGRVPDGIRTFNGFSARAVRF